MGWCWRCQSLKAIAAADLCWPCYQARRRQRFDVESELAAALDRYWPTWSIWRDERVTELQFRQIASEVAANELERFWLVGAA